MIATINCHTRMRIQEDWYNMSCLPKREKLDPKQASAIDFAVLQDGNFYVSGEAGARKSVVLAGSGATGSEWLPQ